MKNSPNIPQQPVIIPHPIALNAFDGKGVCYKDRPTTPIDTLIIHSCYVEPRVIRPARIEEVKSFTLETARGLYTKWEQAKATEMAELDPQKQILLAAKSQELEFLAIHTLIRARHDAAALSVFSVDAIQTIFEFYGVSANYIIDRAGKIFELVPTTKLAFHAGKSKMPRAEDGRESVNQFSLGVELLGTDDSGFTNEQYKALATLTRYLMSSHPICNFYGHSDVAPGRKTDPWGFDWQRYKREMRFDSCKHFTH